jgi:hypothetical protein
MAAAAFLLEAGSFPAVLGVEVLRGAAERAPRRRLGRCLAPCGGGTPATAVKTSEPAPAVLAHVDLQSLEL